MKRHAGLVKPTMPATQLIGFYEFENYQPSARELAPVPGPARIEILELHRDEFTACWAAAGKIGVPVLCIDHTEIRGAIDTVLCALMRRFEFLVSASWVMNNGDHSEGPKLSVKVREELKKKKRHAVP